MLSHEIEAEKQLMHFGEELNEFVSIEEKRLNQLQWDHIEANMYWSRKVRVCVQQLGQRRERGGGVSSGMHTGYA